MQHSCLSGSRRLILAVFAPLLIVLAAAPAAAQMMLTGVGPGVRATAPTFSVDYRGVTSTSTAVGNVFTLSGVSIGTPSPNRKVVFAVVHRSGGSVTVTSVTINGGSPLTPIVDEVSFPSSTRSLRVYEVAVAAGPTADFAITTSGATSAVGVIVYAVTTTQSTYSARSGADTTRLNGVGSLTIPAAGGVTVPAGGVGIAFVRVNLDVSVAWSQTSGVGTRDADHAITGGSQWVSSYQTAATGSQAFLADGADGTSYIGAAVAYAP